MFLKIYKILSLGLDLKKHINITTKTKSHCEYLRVCSITMLQNQHVKCINININVILIKLFLFSIAALKKGRFWITPDPYHNDDHIQIGREVKISCQVR